MKKLLFIFFSFTFLNASDIQKAFLVAVYDKPGLCNRKISI